MKKFELNLEFPGIVIFDPVVLSNFLEDKKITDRNILNHFIANETIGKEAINLGVIYPIYTIPELDYTIYASDNNKNNIPEEWKIFSIKQFGLKVESKTLIFSDIYAIMDWTMADRDFFLNYRKNYSNKSDSNDYYEIPNGNFIVQITGFRNKKNNIYDTEKGYQINFHQILELPQVLNKIDIDNIDYDIT